MMNKMTVHMTKETLYDFLLFHAYSKFSGFLINILGLAIAFMGILLYITDRTNAFGVCLYLAAALVFLASTPLQLKIRAKKQVLVNEEYCNPVEYTFSEEEIRVECGGKERSYQWEEIGRAVVTPKTIGIYYGKEQAMILPKQDFGEQFAPIFKLIAARLGQSRVRMR
ncbi:YcxB family protein [Lachnospiraceae bacterium 50-23]